MKIILKSIILFSLIFFIASCSSENGQGSSNNSPTKISANPIKDSPFKLADYHNKKLLIVYWATWCKPCVEEVPIMISIQKKYGGEAFSVVGISVDQSKQSSQKFIDKHKINYPAYMTDKGIEELFGPVFGLPTILFVDETGKVVTKHMGYIPKKTLLKAVESFKDKS